MDQGASPSLALGLGAQGCVTAGREQGASEGPGQRRRQEMRRELLPGVQSGAARLTSSPLGPVAPAGPCRGKAWC